MSRSCLICSATVSRPYRQAGAYTILVCGACGIRFLDPHPTAAELELLYGEAYFAHAVPGAPGYDRYLEEMDHIRRTFDDRLRRLPGPTPGAARLLDVGAAVGLFVERARASGWDAEGIEPSTWAARYARDVLAQPVHCGTLDSVDVAASSVDVVTMWEVIEHLPDPEATLRAIHRVLRPGGTLALSTPDAGATIVRLLGRRWPGWQKTPEHLFFFDRPTLRLLLDRTGFQVESERHVPLVVSRGYLFDRLGKIVGWLPHRWFPDRWLERPIRVNPLYDLMIVARKR